MANGTIYNWRNIALGVVAAIVVLLVILWLTDVFETTTEQPLAEDPEAQIVPEPEGEEPQQE